MFQTVDLDDNTTAETTSDQENTTAGLPKVSSDVQESSGSNKNVQDSDKNKKNRSRYFDMILGEILFLVALALTAYGALHNSPPKVSRQPSPTSFFGEESPVKDWYNGKLIEVLIEIGHSDVSFVMYYAPWDAESQHLRHEFEKVASVLHKQVNFAAVNCWNPGSECRQHHNKIPSWPVLMAYVNSKGVMYRGPRDANSMMKFILQIIKPLERITTFSEFLNLVSICDATVIGFTPFTDGPKYYNTYYNAALKSKAHDPLGQVCFAVVTSEELAKLLAVKHLPMVRVVTWNETRDYSESTELLTDNDIIVWVWETLQTPVLSFVPLWQKSTHLQLAVEKYPVLILFTPMNHLYQQKPAYDMLRELAMEYHNCKGNRLLITEMTRFRYMQRILYQTKFDNATTLCDNLKKKRDELEKMDVEVKPARKTLWHNITVKEHKFASKKVLSHLVGKEYITNSVLENEEHIFRPFSHDHLLNEDCDGMFSDGLGQCRKSDQCTVTSTDNDLILEVKPKSIPGECAESLKKSTLNDPYSSESLKERHINEFCEVLWFAQQLSMPVVPDLEQDTAKSLLGLMCQTNRTLKFMVMDSLQNYHFAESLGLDIKKRKMQTGAVILDNMQETQYILHEDFSESALRNFIHDFSTGHSVRHLRSVVPSAHTHYYNSQSKSKAETSNQTRNTVNIPELTGKTFLKYALQSKKAVIVLMCAGACPSHVSVAAMSAVGMARAVGLTVSAARVDCLRNDLPWEFTFSTFPTIIVFPPHPCMSGGGCAEYWTAVFPAGRRVSAAGMAGLLQRALPPPHALWTRLAVCHATHVKGEKTKCLHDMKDYVINMISESLRSWRTIHDTRTRRLILRRLQTLRQISILLTGMHASDATSHKPKLSQLISIINKLVDVWTLAAHDITSLSYNNGNLVSYPKDAFTQH